MLKRLITVIFFLVSISASASDGVEVVCSYAPSQSKAVSALSGAAGGSSAALLAVSQATGLTVVAHSSGAAILTGSSGYIAGTLGAASAGPIIVGVGLVVGGVAVTVELICAPKNHKVQVRRIESAAQEFSARAGALMTRTNDTVKPHIDNASVAVKQVAGDIFEYAYRRIP